MTDDALFLDFDGTLVDIVDRPEAVVVDPALPGVLARLRERLGGALALVSGRSIATLDAFLDPFRPDAAGMHGIERRIGGRSYPCDPSAHPALRKAAALLRAQAQEWPGVLVEDKGCSVAFHWRLAPDHAAAAQALMIRLETELGEGYRLQAGKAVAEILPAGASKGAVIAAMMKEPPYRGRRAVFVGDDLTDEKGFAVVNDLGGLSVRIGEGETIAPIRLASPAVLRKHLVEWAQTGRLEFH